MPRGNDNVTKVVYQGKADDFIIFIDDVAAAQQWKNDKTIPLAQVVSGWKVFVTHKWVSLAAVCDIQNEFYYTDMCPKH